MSLSRPLPGEFDPAYGAYLAEAPEGDVLALLEAQGREIQALYGGLGKGQGNHRYAPGKWSLKDLLLHLTDAERIFAYRCLRIGRGDETPLPGFDEEAFATAGQADACWASSWPCARPASPSSGVCHPRPGPAGAPPTAGPSRRGAYPSCAWATRPTTWP